MLICYAITDPPWTLERRLFFVSQVNARLPDHASHIEVDYGITEDGHDRLRVHIPRKLEPVVRPVLGQIYDSIVEEIRRGH